MEKMKMQSRDIVGSNVEKIRALFPHCVTERKGENGELELAVDFEKLQLELSNDIIAEGEERYQFTWPDKRKAIREANVRTTSTLRPYRAESVDFDNTENLYIEGDNLEVLKVLRETYLGKVKMIYIDPPYNTGNDFVYNDDFAENASKDAERSLFRDEEGNILLEERVYTKNTESNGRFHTDWLNMMYPRLKVARDLLTEDGVIFISIDDNEYDELKRICDEILGSNSFIATIVRNTNSTKSLSLFVSVSHEYCVTYAKNIECLKLKHSNNKWAVPKNNIEEYISKVNQLKNEGLSSEEITEELKTLTKYPRFIDFTNYWYFDERGLYMKDNLGGVSHGNMEPIYNPITCKYDDIPPGGFRYSSDKMKELVRSNRIHFHSDGSLPRLKRYLADYTTQRPKSIMSDDQRPDASMMSEFNTPFNNPKQLSFMKRIISIADKDSLILDFFSGSATTAHAVMKLNAEDGGNRKFIMVQLPEKTEEKSEAYKAGYKNICEIGKERIRRAGKKVKEEAGLQGQNLDTGFRVLKLDSSNMEDVFYTPESFDASKLFVDNVKVDRTSEDLLFQVMLELGVELSAKIESREVSGKEVYFVDDNYLIACFDTDVNEATIIEIAKMNPVYFVMRDSSMLSDNVADNFDQIFQHYSKDTVRRIL